jgi:hypothetical protein
MKPFDYYSTTTLPYPSKLDYINLYVYDKGKLLYEGFASTNSKNKLKLDYPNAVIQEVLDKVAYQAYQQQYAEEIHKLEEEFQNDLFQEFAVTDNPKRFKCYSYAWDKGHSHGYSEVYNEFSDVVELIREWDT